MAFWIFSGEKPLLDDLGSNLSMELTLEEVGEFALGLSIISYYPDKLSWAVVFLFLSILKDVSFEAFEYMDPYLREITELIL